MTNSKTSPLTVRTTNTQPIPQGGLRILELTNSCFPQTDWPENETEDANQTEATTKHLWEESWDDDDTNDDFSAQLKYE